MKIIQVRSSYRPSPKGLKTMSFLGNIKEFDESDDIELYLERLQQYFKANDVKDETRAPILLTLIGPKPYAVLRNLVSPKTVDSLDFDAIVKQLKSHYSPKKLLISERFKFYKRDQLPSESISNYVIQLKQLASQCNFNSFLEEALRDRFVCGITNKAIQRKLLTEDNLTFSKSVELAVSLELASSEIKSFHSESAEVNKVVQRNVGERRCNCCGGSNHVWFNCKFKTYKCNVCNKIGHLAKVCYKKSSVNNERPSNSKCSNRSTSKSRYKQNNKYGNKSKNVNSVNFENSVEFVTSKSEESEIGLNVGERKHSFDLYKLESVNTVNQPFQLNINVDGKMVSAEIDTGAGRTVMAQPLFSKLFPNYYLCKSNMRLKTYLKEPIQVVGEAIVNVSVPDKNCNRPKNNVSRSLPLLIIKSKDVLPTLIGRDWIKALNLDLNTVRNNNCESIFSNMPTIVTNGPIFKMQNSIVEVASLKQKYPDVFKAGFGLIQNFEAKLVCKPNVRPTFYKARPVPFSMKPVVEQELKKLKENGIIEPISHSDWASCIVVVPKHNSDKVRICGDFKNVNQCLKTEHYPLPNIEDLFQPLANGKVFTVLDISNAFQQLKVSEDSRPYLTVNTHLGLFRYTRLPFGISSAPSIYQSIMDQVLQGIPNVGCYIDDIIISGSDLSSCKDRVEQVLSRLQKYGITVNEDKCKFFEPKVEYLGYLIDSKGLHPMMDKIKAIKETKPPQNVKELKAYLGLLNYYHKFIPNLSTKLEPLYRLLLKDVQFVFDKEQMNCFVNSKTWLEKYNVLSHYDPSQELVLCCDASSVGVGAVISNRDPNGNEKPIHFASRTLSKHERNYAHIEREALGIVYGLKKFHRYLYGRSFVLQTDNKSLSIILHPSKCIPTMSAMRMQRWALLLSSYNYKVEFCKGKQIAHADFLSRMPLCNTVDPVSSEINLLSPTRCKPLSSYDIAAETRRDALLSKVLDLTWLGWPNQVDKELEPYFKHRNELSIDQDCILWGNRVIIPCKLRQEILNLLHEEHPGITKMKMLARSYVWWPELENDIVNLVKFCQVCQLAQNAIPKVPITPWSVSSRRWECLHIDFAKKDGKNFFLVIDSFSKWTEIFIMDNTNANSTISKLRTLFSSYGLPEKIVSDNGPPYNSFEFENFCNMNGIKLIHSPPYHPASNGIVERSVQTFKKSLLKSLIENKYLSKPSISLQHKIDNFLFAYRSTPHSFTGVSPSELFLKCKLRTRLSSLKPNLVQHLKQKRDNLVKGMNQNKSQMRSFESGDKVLVRSVRGEDIKWFPGKIVKKLSDVTYTVQVRDQLRFVHADHLKPHFCKSDEPRIFENVEPSLLDLPDNQDICSDSDNQPLVVNISPKKNVNISPKKNVVNVSSKKYFDNGNPKINEPQNDIVFSDNVKQNENVQQPLVHSRPVRIRKAPDKLNL